jgi:hypothetical protein
MTKKNKLFCFDKKFLIMFALFILGLLFIFKDKLTNDNESCDCD